MYFRIEKHPIPQSANLKVSDARQGNPKGMPCLYFITGRGIRHKNSFQNKSNLRKERGKLKCHFLQQQ